MDSTYLIGLDAGTTSVKGLLISLDGSSETVVRKEYSLEYIGSRMVELDPEVYWQATVRIIGQLLAKSGVRPEQVKALAFSSQGETLIAVDRAGRPLRKAIIWLDNRSEKEARAIEDHFGKQAVLEKTGQPEIIPMWPATRILWLGDHEPVIFKQTAKFLLVEDYLVACLTGQYNCAESMASSTLYFDIREKEWWGDMLDFLHISPDHLPRVVPSGTPVGTISKAAASVTGLTPGTIVVTGAYDHPAGAIGAGNIREGMVSETTGTAMAMCVTLDGPVIDSSLNLPCQCHAVPGKYLLLPYGQTAGLVLRWFRDVFCAEEQKEAEKNGRKVYDIITGLAADVPPGADGLVMLPHFMGAGPPEFDVHIRGVFAGITPEMKKGHFIRAIMEAIACMINRNLETLTSHHIAVKEIRALGGGAESDLWNQIKADLTGVPYITTRSRETACLGAAILAGAGSGYIQNIQEGCDRLVKQKKIFMPDREQHEVYKKVYDQYVNLYERMKGYW
jgi:xylulokinase